MAYIEILDEIDPGPRGSWRLTFQRGRWHFGGGRIDDGYRFMFRRDDDSLQAARGQALISTLDQAQDLINQARDLGWVRKYEQQEDEKEEDAA